jgi:hypothetical protein
LKECREHLGSEAVAIETGTYLGDSALILGKAFSQCTTIELDIDLARNAEQRLRRHTNIKVVQGTTREMLPKILGETYGPALVWLDAHFSGGVTAGEDDKCPLMGEVDELIRVRNNENTVILIDDARALLGHDDWPFLGEVVGLFDRAGWAVASIDDVLIATNRETLRALLNGVNSKSRLIFLEQIAGKWKVVQSSVAVVQFFTRLIALLNTAFRLSKIRRKFSLQ